MKRFGSLAAAAVLSTVTLTGCGGSDEDFCDAFESLESLGSDNPIAVFDGVDRLVDAAPGDVEDDAETVGAFYDEVRDAVGEAGVDLDGVDDSADLSDEDRDAATEAAEAAVAEADDGELQEAGDNIDAWVDENCAA